jgi:hypothetical protein
MISGAMAEMGEISPVRMSGVTNKNAITPIRISDAMAEKGWMTPVRISVPWPRKER